MFFIIVISFFSIQKLQMLIFSFLLLINLGRFVRLFQTIRFVFTEKK